MLTRTRPAAILPIALAAAAACSLDLPGRGEYASGQPAVVGLDASPGPDATIDAVEDVSIDESAAEPDAPDTPMDVPAEAPAQEGGEDAAVEPGTMGAACASPSSCHPGLFCAGKQNHAADGTCTRTCCRSADCDAGFVCLSGFGGSVCVAANALGFEIGAGAAGAMCASGSDCLSGRCTENRCVDACCSEDDCLPPSTCALGNYAGIPGWECRTWTSGHEKKPAQLCADDYECVSGMCVGNATKFCSVPCCGICDLGAKCTYVQAGAGPATTCFIGGTDLGVCCVDADCSNGKKCIPMLKAVPDVTPSPTWVMICQ